VTVAGISIHIPKTAEGWTAFASGVLAVLGVASFIISLSATTAARKAAKASLAQVQAAFPVLDVTARPFGSDAVQVVATVIYVAGSLPAREIVVWARGPGMPGPVYRGDMALLSPRDAPKGVIAEPDDAGDGTRNGSAFRDFPESVADKEGYVGVTWVDPDDKRKWWGYRMTDGKTNPRPITR